MTDPDTYTVTDEDGDQSLEVNAEDVEDAAKTWAEIVARCQPNHVDEMICIVYDPYGLKWRVTVRVEMMPWYHATECEEVPRD